VSAVRVPQEERTRAMRQRLLEATIDCLVEHGWSGTSTTQVSQRAGVSRGAQLHHFPTKNDLVVAAVVPLEQRVGREAHRIAVEALGVDEEQPRARELVQATLDLVRGLGLANTISDDTARRRRILSAWAQTLDAELRKA